MIITFEGPDCSGKTTQAKALCEYIKEHYPKLGVIYKHFPDHDRKDIKLFLHDKDIANPYFVAASYMNEFFYTFNSDEKVPCLNDENKKYTYREAAKANDVVLILDRYYYSSLIMCPHWPNKFDFIKVTSDAVEKEKQSYLNNVFGVTGLLLQKYDLPPSDLNIVMIPDEEDFNERLKFKNNDKSVDRFESIKSKALDFYYDYRHAVEGKTPLFYMNGEQLGPVVLHNKSQAYIPNSGKLNDIMNKNCRFIYDNTKDVEESKKIVQGVFGSYLSMRLKLVESKNLEGNKIALSLWNLGRLTAEDIYTKQEEERKTINPDLDGFKKEIEESLKEVKVEPPDNPIEEYKLTGKEPDAYEIIGSPIGVDVIKSPDKYILSKQYNLSERIMVYTILLKILRSEHTKNTNPLDKITETTKYIYRKLEQLHAGAVTSTEGNKTDEDIRESEGSSKSEDTTKEE